MVGLLLSLGSYGQQMPTTNLYDQNLFFYNPAGAGKNGYMEGFLTHRQQWTGIDGAPVTNSLSIHKRIWRKIGIGANIISDRSDLLERISGTFTYAFMARLSNESKLTVALAPGFYHNKLDLSGVRVDDLTDQLLSNSSLSKTSFTTDFGIRFSRKELDINVAVPNVFQPQVKYDVGSFELTRHVLAYAGYRINFAEGRWGVKPSTLLRMVPGGDQQVDVNAHLYWKNILWAGMTYRQAGIAPSFGVKIADQFSVAYSYEFSSSGIASFSNGSHEIQLGIHLARKKEKDPLEEMENDLQEDSTANKLDELNDLFDDFDLFDEPDTTPVTIVNGIFEFKELPKEGQQLKLVDAEDNELKIITTDSNGRFQFEELATDKDYRIFMVGDDYEDAELFLVNSNGEKVQKATKIGENAFKFTALSPDQTNIMPVLANDDATVNMHGLFEFKNLPRDQQKIQLVDPDGNEVDVVITDRFGKFDLQELALDKEYRLKTDDTYPEPEIFIVNNAGEKVYKAIEISKHVYRFKPMTEVEVESLPVLPANETTPVKEEGGRGYYVVIECQATASGAARGVEKWQEKGYTIFITRKQGSRWHQIALSKHGNRTEAIDKMIDTRRSGIKDAWVSVHKE